MKHDERGQQDVVVDARRRAPAASRNREPIFSVLSRVLPGAGVILELGSGTGEHAVDYATRLTRHVWQPSDLSAEARASVAAWRRHAGPELASRLRAPIELDARSSRWLAAPAAATPSAS